MWRMLSGVRTKRSGGEDTVSERDVMAIKRMQAACVRLISHVHLTQ